MFKVIEDLALADKLYRAGLLWSRQCGQLSDEAFSPDKPSPEADDYDINDMAPSEDYLKGWAFEYAILLED